MLTESIKKKITVQYGHPIRYSKDCENLAIHITEKVGANISASTVKRLFGFVKTTSKPNKYTLDIIARYLDTKNWEELVKSPDVSIALNKKNTYGLTSILFYSLGCCLLGIFLFNIQFFDKKPQYNHKWKLNNGLPEVRKGGTALKDATTIYYLGGSDAEFIRSTNWSYSINKKKWKRLKDLPKASAEMGCVIFKNKIYCFGGWQGEKLGASDEAHVYSIQKNTWDTLPNLPKAMVSVKALVFQNNIYILGGTLSETKNYFLNIISKHDNTSNFQFLKQKEYIFICKNRILQFSFLVETLLKMGNIKFLTQLIHTVF